VSKLFKNIIGLKKLEFDRYLKRQNARNLETNEKISAIPARLIPMIKPGDEKALTSIFLSALKLVKEFRASFLSAAEMIKSGEIFVYTEINFTSINEYSDSIPDGLILIIKKGVIRDAAFVEVKNGANSLDINQIEKYTKLAKEIGIAKIITISNQFVSDPTQCLLEMKKNRSVSLYHFSWLFLLTMGHLLLFENEDNIEDEDQIEIMKEVLAYFDDPRSQIFGFTQMKPGWKETVKKIVDNIPLKKHDQDVRDAVVSWQQEEMDLALKLSMVLGLMVKAGSSKYKHNLLERINHDIQHLIKYQELESIFKIKGGLDIWVVGDFRSRTIEMSIDLLAPENKKARGQISWLNRQLEKCSQQEPETFKNINEFLRIDIAYKRRKKFAGPCLKDFAYFEVPKYEEIKEFSIVCKKDLGTNFSAPKKFVSEIENMLLDFYISVIQNITPWVRPVPKVHTYVDGFSVVENPKSLQLEDVT